MILPSLTNNDIHLIILQLIASIVLLVIILIISDIKRLNIKKRIITAASRGFIQLLTLSIFLVYIFSITSLIYQFLVLGIMISFGAITASKRIEVFNVFKVELIALSISVYTVMTIVTLIGAIPISDPKIFIPIGGMATGNSMNISYLTLNQIKKELDNRRDHIEAALSLGLKPTDVLSELNILSSGLRMGVTPSMNNLRTLGLVFIPGLMTGLLIGGINPVIAAVYQVMIFFVIISVGLIAAVIASYLFIHEIFDDNTQSYKY